MKFSQKVIFVRAQLNVSQESLAQMLHVSFSTINRWEQERTMPSKKTQIVFEQFCKKQNIAFSDKSQEEA